MKNSILFLCLIICFLHINAQQYNINWGEALKMKKGTMDLNIAGADKSGYYFIETKVAAKMFSLNVRPAYKLIKFDNNFDEEYDQSYNDELKGLDFLSFQPLNNDFFLFATDYIKKEKTYKVYGARIDKSDGKLSEEFKELGSYQAESKKDDFTAKLSKLKNNNNFLLVCDLTAKDNTRIGVTILDESLKQKSNTSITLSFEPGFYILQDVKVVNDRIVLLGKVFEEVEGKRKKKKKVFKNFTLGIYDLQGNKQNETQLDINDNFTLEGKLLEISNNEVAIAGLFSKDAKKKNLSGFFINKIDLQSGKLTLNSTKEISENMLGQNFTDEGDDTDDDAPKDDKKKKNDDDDDDNEFLNEFTIKNIVINPADGSFVITSEISKVNVSTSSYYENNGNAIGGGRWVTRTTYSFTNKDIMVICADNSGNIKWLNIIPKKQYESISSESHNQFGPVYYDSYYYMLSYFAKAGGMPYYSSFNSLFVKDKYIILYNDNKNNTEIADYKEKVRSITNFKKKGVLFALSFDLKTGKAVKTNIAASSDEDVIAMPRHSFVFGNNIIIPSWRQKMIGKTIFKIAKVTIK